jgi:hypothetical protein
MKNTTLGFGVQPQVRDSLNALLGLSGLPFIAGKWFFVDPKEGSDLAGGLTQEDSLATLKAAYDLCTDNAGDGIIVIARSGSVSVDTTSYIDQVLTWAKSGITVYGACAPTALFQRSRIANVARTTGSITTLSFNATGSVYTILDSASGFITAGFAVGMKIYVATNSGTNTGTYTITVVAAGVLTVTESVSTESAATAGACTVTSNTVDLIAVTGHNNLFINLHFFNGGALATDVGCVKVSGNRNAFVNCHMVGGGHATPAAVAGMYSLSASGEENSYYHCTIGTDSMIRAQANAEILFAATCKRNVFEDCYILSYSTTAGKGAIKSASATSISGWIIFKRCVFANRGTNEATALTSAFIGTKPDDCGILLMACILVGWSAWDSVAANNRIFVGCAAETAAGAGGIATTI